jgi:hypothetical protein
MKNFMFVGGINAWWIDRTSIGAAGGSRGSIPWRPTPAFRRARPYLQRHEYLPLDALTFPIVAFSDPQGTTRSPRCNGA